jgi:2-keto-4-pentenoate hydratase
MPDLDRAAELIRSCWNSGDVIDYIKGDLWPDTAEEGYAIQSRIARLRGEPVVGWKIAATAVAGRDHINVDRPLAGRLFPSICHQDGAVLPFGRNRMAVAEAEFAFTMGSDLPARDAPYTEGEVADSIASLHAGLELPDSRFKDFTLPGTAGLIADNACASHFVIGAAATQEFDPRALAQHPTTLYINEEPVTTGHGSDALDGPLNAMVWIANTLSDLGIGLQAGQFVTTGVTGMPSPVKKGDTIRADLGMYGSASVTLM